MQPFKQMPSNFITMKNVDVKIVFTSLYNEIKYFSNHVKSLMNEKGGSMYSSKNAVIPLEPVKINELSNLEENTEHNFSLLKKLYD